MPTEALETELLNALAARRGHFQLESGHHGDLWLDLERLFVRPDVVQRAAAELARRLAVCQAQAVCGPLVGGALVAQWLAAALQAEFYYSERRVLRQPGGPDQSEYRLPDGVRPLLQGKTVAVVDDVINAGSAVAATLVEVRRCGARPVALGALVMLGAATPALLAGEALPLEYVARLASGLWRPAGCPLCAAQVPLEDPGRAQRV